jgi:hypothetical protein
MCCSVDDCVGVGVWLYLQIAQIVCRRFSRSKRSSKSILQHELLQTKPGQSVTQSSNISQQFALHNAKICLIYHLDLVAAKTFEIPSSPHPSRTSTHINITSDQISNLSIEQFCHNLHILRFKKKVCLSWFLISRIVFNVHTPPSLHSLQKNTKSCTRFGKTVVGRPCRSRISLAKMPR